MANLKLPYKVKSISQVEGYRQQAYIEPYPSRMEIKPKQNLTARQINRYRQIVGDLNGDYGWKGIAAVFFFLGILELIFLYLLLVNDKGMAALKGLIFPVITMGISYWIHRIYMNALRIIEELESK